MQITIKSYTFTISAPYAAGTIITKGEAQALNNLRAENIQNNLRRYVNEAVEAAKPGLLSQQTLAELHERFAKYDAEYHFAEKVNVRPRLGDIEEEARVVARERIEASFRQSGDQLPEEAIIESMIADQCGLPGIVEEARNRVEARRRVMAEGLESLV